jgi:UDP-glucose 4-epimerase
MKIMVTGGAGFIGSHLVDKLIKEGNKVVVIDNLSTGKKENLNPKAKFYKIDICSPKISEILKKEKPEFVFHLAAKIDVRKSTENPIEDAKVNILGSLNIIQNLYHFSKVKSQKSKLIFASSVGVYGEPKILPVKENHPLNPIAPYSISKLAIEKYLSFYQTQGLDFVSLRYANVYGPRQLSDGEGGVVAIFIDQLLRKKVPTIFGNGNQTRDFVFVEDVISACLKSINYKGKESFFNIATGIETSVNALYRKISKILKVDTKPKYVPEKPGDLKRSCLDISKAKRELNWRPNYNLEEGIIKTANWFKKKSL